MRPGPLFARVKGVWGETVLLTNGDGVGGVFSYQWLAGGADISGAADPTYLPVEADEGGAIRVRATFSDDRGHGRR